MSGLESIRQTVDEMRLLQMEGMNHGILYDLRED